jgi:orotate phosphoribosyltransferase
MEKTAELKDRLFLLIKEKAYHEGAIKLASGKTSNYYIDARAVTLSSVGAYLVGHLLFDLVKEWDIAAVGGPTMGADPMVGALAAVSCYLKKPIDTFLIRKTPKAHGRMRQVEGPEIPEGTEVVLVDDVATTGGSLIDAIAILESSGVCVKKAVVIVDREEGAADNLAKHGCQLLSFFKASDFSSQKK